MTSELQQLSPFQLKDELIRYARDQSHSKAATHKFLNAGRGNPNWIATTPREAFFLLGQFALSESRRTRDEGTLAGMPPGAGVADRLRAFLASSSGGGVDLLQRGLDYATSTLGFDADAFAHELVDGIIGDNYPEPDRMLVHAEKVVHRYLEKTMCNDQPPPGTFDIFAVEGGTAAMCYVFKSLVENRILAQGDTIALGAPIFTPYIELPQLSDYAFKTVEINQAALTESGIHTWQYPDDEIEKLADSQVKAFFLVNPSNPSSYAIHRETQERIVELVRAKRPDLIILTDDVYGTFAEGFRSLAADLPRNTILVYSYSKHFGCTGWRLGVIALHQHNVLDQALAALPSADRDALHERYRTLSTTPERIKFIDRIVADSRDVALNHTAGLSTPQQVQMVLFSLFALLDRDDAYQKRCRELVRDRLQALGRGLGFAVPEDPLRVGYYIDIDLAVWGRIAFGDEFGAFVAAHHDPLDIVIALAKRSGTVLLNGSGFDGPPWSVRISLANLDADEYEAIGKDLKDLMTRTFAEWQRSRKG